MRLRFTLLILIFSFFISCTKDEVFELPSDDQTTSIDEDSSITDLEPSNLEVELFDAVNNYRKSQDLAKLKFDKYTYSEALGHNKFMIAKGKRSHANFKSRASKIAKKVGAKLVAENIADNYTTIEEVLEAWKDSDSHKENLDGDFTHSAISIKEDKKGKLYFTQIFFK